ncbi:hypothetical protein AMAG_18992 [Allomyces macrogynus ATCC 38327]|uniref:Uncharacterized protein n=1 Tax=Allomyces macrogynus (strain ATCC 38327) TaxID=578462 RepID=A0A0L0SLS2_ALLM3|nr:hypothetical protein AMAG_18992 [Allomyces macrogynus ATCC 38327]|eukprot:KNE63349.1 hypothetical protein AMAG_18992 [Allomyces macrogynus ATCC 38327]
MPLAIIVQLQSDLEVFLVYYTTEEAIVLVMAYFKSHLVVWNRQYDTEGYVLAPHEADQLWHAAVTMSWQWGQCRPPPYKLSAEEID